MEQVQLGVDHLKKAVKFAIDVAKQVEESGKDGWTYMDSFSFIDELSALPGLIKSAGDILAELKQLDPADRAELNTYIQTEFDIADDRLEGIIEDALSLAFGMLGLIQKIRTPKETV